VTGSARPAAIEDPTNLWLVHPLADRLLAPALRLGLHPNLVSLAGLGSGAAAGWCYWQWRQPGMVAAGFLMMLAWHVLDGLDGKLARASGKATPFGRLLDGVVDYLVFFCVLIPIAVGYPDWGRTLTLCLTAGGFHAVQAAWLEGEREAWKRRAAGRFAPRPRLATGSLLEAGHNRLEAWLSRPRPIDAALAADPAALPRYLAGTAPLLRGLGILSANYRTIAIPLACLAGDPRLFWGWEIFGLTLIAMAIVARLRHRENDLAGA